MTETSLQRSNHPTMSALERKKQMEQKAKVLAEKLHDKHRRRHILESLLDGLTGGAYYYMVFFILSIVLAPFTAGLSPIIMAGIHFINFVVFFGISITTGSIAYKKRRDQDILQQLNQLEAEEKLKQSVQLKKDNEIQSQRLMSLRETQNNVYLLNANMKAISLLLTAQAQQEGSTLKDSLQENKNIDALVKLQTLLQQLDGYREQDLAKLDNKVLESLTTSSQQTYAELCKLFQVKPDSISLPTQISAKEDLALINQQYQKSIAHIKQYEPGLSKTIMQGFGLAAGAIGITGLFATLGYVTVLGLGIAMGPVGWSLLAVGSFVVGGSFLAYKVNAILKREKSDKNIEKMQREAKLTQRKMSMANDYYHKASDQCQLQIQYKASKVFEKTTYINKLFHLVKHDQQSLLTQRKNLHANAQMAKEIHIVKSTTNVDSEKLAESKTTPSSTKTKSFQHKRRNFILAIVDGLAAGSIYSTAALIIAVALAPVTFGLSPLVMAGVLFLNLGIFFLVSVAAGSWMYSYRNHQDNIQQQNQQEIDQQKAANNTLAQTIDANKHTLQAQRDKHTTLIHLNSYVNAMINLLLEQAQHNHSFELFSIENQEKRNQIIAATQSLLNKIEQHEHSKLYRLDLTELKEINKEAQQAYIKLCQAFQVEPKAIEPIQSMSLQQDNQAIQERYQKSLISIGHFEEKSSAKHKLYAAAKLLGGTIGISGLIWGLGYAVVLGLGIGMGPFGWAALAGISVTAGVGFLAFKIYSKRRQATVQKAIDAAQQQAQQQHAELSIADDYYQEQIAEGPTRSKAINAQINEKVMTLRANLITVKKYLAKTEQHPAQSLAQSWKPKEAIELPEMLNNEIKPKMEPAGPLHTPQ